MTAAVEGEIRANGLRFRYLEMGRGPLVLLLHGFPDTAHTWQRMMPALAGHGLRVVAPWLRGYHPSEVPAAMPADGQALFVTLGADANALRDALGGGPESMIVGHDWGAVATYSAALQSPTGWRRCVTLAVPPLPVLARRHARFAQLKRSFYMWFFQQRAAEAVVAADDFAFLHALWKDWSPGYDPREALAHVASAFRQPGSLQAALAYYRAFFDPARFDFDYGDAIGPIAPPLLYLHGADDGCVGLAQADLEEVRGMGGEGSETAWLAGAGHFLHLEQGARVATRIARFLVDGTNATRKYATEPS